MLSFLFTAFGEWLKSTHLTELSVWIAQTPVSVTLSQNSWVTPIVQSIHIMAIAVTFGAALMINLRILGLSGRAHGMAEIEDRYAPWVTGGLLVLLATGFELVIAEPARELLNPFFWTKMSLVVLVALANIGLQRSVRAYPGRWDAGPDQSLGLRLGAGALIVVWGLVMVCGRWIAYGV
jgi:hypothetical protein